MGVQSKVPELKGLPARQVEGVGSPMRVIESAGRRLRTAGLVAAVVGGSLVATTTHAAAGVDCAKVKFIGAAGSGQSTAPPHGYGLENQQMSTRLGALLDLGSPDPATNDGGYRATWISYTAAPVDVLIPSKRVMTQINNPGTRPFGLLNYKTEHFDRYMASVDQGVDAMISAIQISYYNCPAEKVVVSGYSQGALVVHRAVNILHDRDPKALDAVAAIVLISDPARTPNSNTIKFGGSSRDAQGVETYLKAFFLQGENRDIRLPGVTANVCDAADIVCDFNWTRLTTAGLSSSIHTTNYKQSWNLGMRQAASWVAGVVKAYNRP